jgi:signal transduction histidine kinase
MLAFLRSEIEHLGQIIHSIRFRITLWTLGVLVIVLFAFSAFIFYNQRVGLEISAIARLSLHARQMAHGPVVMGNPQDGDVIALVNQDGKVLQNYGTLKQQEIDNVISALKTNDILIPPDNFVRIAVNQSSWFDFAHVGALYLVGKVDDAASNASYMVMIGTQVDPTGMLPVLLGGLIRYSLAILLVALLGGYWLAGRMIAPVQKITRTAQEINATDLSRRIRLKTRDELGELASTFDRMLDRLQAAFDRQRQFTADASHELRTPLTIVDLEASRALEHPRSPEEYEQALKVIQSENEYMSRLVNNLLTLARMDAGRANLKPDRIDLGDLAVEVIERLEPLARQKCVELVAGELPEVIVNGDRQYLIQMLTNLVENAIKYSRPEGGRVGVVAGTCLDDGKPTGWVRVEDNGPGIPQEAIPHLFDRFYRVDAARSHNNPDGSAETGEVDGSGLGLSIVEWIVTAHGGHIHVNSQLGMGSSFEVEIPLAGV